MCELDYKVTHCDNNNRPEKKKKKICHSQKRCKISVVKWSINKIYFLVRRGTCPSARLPICVD